VRYFPRILLSIALSCTAVSGYADDRSFKLIPENDRSFKLKLGGNRDTRFNFREMNALSLSRDFRVFVPIRTDDDFQDVHLRTANGREVTFRTGVKFKDEEVVVLSDTLTGRQFIVSSTNIVDGKKQITFSAVDRQHRFITDLKREDIALFDKYGREMCFGLKGVRGTNVPFLASMPFQANCTIYEFETEYNALVEQESCYQTKDRFSISAGGGGTAIYPALRKVYEDVKGEIKVVLVVSDGASATVEYDEALKAKDDTTTLVNWLGSYSKDYPLADFADAEIFGSIEEDGTLPDFFNRASEALNAQYVVNECQ